MPMSVETASGGLPPVLTGRKALIVGVANDRSIAWGCAQAMHRAGAEFAMTYLNDKARPHGDGTGDHARAQASFLTGKQVVYFGRKGESHVEYFPDSKP